MDESNRVPPLNLTKDEASYLWGLITDEIGKDEVWSGDDTETVRSLHDKIGRAGGKFDDETEPEVP